MRILIVEDDALVAELCGRILEDEGYRCTLARDVAAAREAIAQLPIDLVLADIVLPGGTNGREFAEEMRVAGVPVIFMSGEYTALRALDAAGIRHLRKPFRMPDLVSWVRDALARPPRRSARGPGFRSRFRARRSCAPVRASRATVRRPRRWAPDQGMVAGATGLSQRRRAARAERGLRIGGAPSSTPARTS
jgi:DNA-binding response OmpR family regulator